MLSTARDHQASWEGAATCPHLPSPAPPPGTAASKLEDRDAQAPAPCWAALEPAALCDLSREAAPGP